MNKQAIYLSSDSQEYTSKKDGQKKVYIVGNFLVDGSFMQFSLNKDQLADLKDCFVGTSGELVVDMKAFQGKPYVKYASFTW